MKITIKFLLLSAIVLSLSVSAFARQDGGCDANVPMNDGICEFDNILPMINFNEIGDAFSPFLNDVKSETKDICDAQVASTCWVLLVIQELHCYPSITVSKGSMIEISLQHPVNNPWSSIEGRKAIESQMFEKFKYNGALSHTSFQMYTCEEWNKK